MPIVPIAITGTEHFQANLKRWRRTPVRFVVGAPFRLPPNGRAKGEALDAYTTLIMSQLAALLPPGYRGVYADHPRTHALLALNGEPASTATLV